MKSTRRHQLKENVLAHEIQELKAFFSKYGGWIAGALLVVGILVVVYVQYRAKQRKILDDQRQQSVVLKEGGGADRGERLKGFMDSAAAAKDTLSAASSTVWVGDLYSQELVDEYPAMDSEKATEARANAEKYYRMAIAGYPELKPVVAKAHLGLGILAENSGDKEAARAEYAKAAQLVGPGAKAAAERQANLDKWFAAAKLPAEAVSTRPAAESETQPATSLPAAITQPAETQPAETQPAGTQPAGTQPAGTQPAGTQPAGTP